MHKIRTCQSVGRIEDRPPKMYLSTTSPLLPKPYDEVSDLKIYQFDISLVSFFWEKDSNFYLKLNPNFRAQVYNLMKQTNKIVLPKLETSSFKVVWMMDQ